MQNKKNHWSICPECYGEGKKNQKLSNKAKRLYKKELLKYEKSGNIGPRPVQPKGHMSICDYCQGSGLINSEKPTSPDASYPHVAIIGGGIGGVALAVACFHRGIPFTLYERDKSFDARSQGYGLTLQQASKSIESFGISGLRDEIRTTRHLVHTPDGKVIGEWGKKKETTSNEKPKQKNIHISRQSLRMQLLEELDTSESIQWGHQLIDVSQNNNGRVDLVFQVGEKKEKAQTDLVVGADGIRSIVRKCIIKEDNTPLQYTGFIVILGICDINNLVDTKSDLLDGKTIFQTVNGHERIYVMPYSHDAIMWQMSFPMTEDTARSLSAKGPDELKQEAIRRAPWHNPIPQMLSQTHRSKITGYPIYDKEILSVEQLQKAGNATLIGDSAHPMSPFKGQGANRALLDALLLSRMIYSECRPGSEWQKKGIRKTVLEKFESEMIKQSAAKVRDSREAGILLHSDAVLHDGETPRGRGIKRKK